VAELGFVGLGTMGSRMAKRLLDAGHAVTGHNRTKAKAAWLIDAGMKWGENPRAVAEASDVVFSMVSDTRALEAITSGEDGIVAGLRAGSIYVDMSTVLPEASRAIARQVAANGAAMLDAPVSGSVITLEQGALSIMAAGDREAFERVKPLLLDIGPKVNYVGANGLAVTMKIATNLSLPTQMLGYSEGLLIAEKAGIPRDVAVEVLLNSVMASPMVKYRGPFVLGMPEEPWFDVRMMQKDLLLALELGRQLEVPLPTTGLTNEFLTAARAMGYAEEDFAALFDVLAHMAGVER
jgi:3-hydroxyisobutyrate dehydrogenase-like beta-hydroxyacid dehydrogenase